MCLMKMMILQQLKNFESYLLHYLWWWMVQFFRELSSNRQSSQFVVSFYLSVKKFQCPPVLNLKQSSMLLIIVIYFLLSSSCLLALSWSKLFLSSLSIFEFSIVICNYCPSLVLCCCRQFLKDNI